jgi:hypothetical protein
VVLVAPAVAPVPVAAAQDPAAAVVAAARGYLGIDFRMGAEGPKYFDCSGLVFRVFADIGELPRIGGMRWGATMYKRWFVARGRFSKDVDDAEPGDLVVWDEGQHIGVYIGGGKAISALRNPWGVSVHGIHRIPMEVTQFLLVNWGSNGGGDNGGDNGGDTGGDTGGDNGGGEGPGNGDSSGSTGSTPGGSTPPTDSPPATNPPANNPPATSPPATSPPANNPVAPEAGRAVVRNQSGVLPADHAADRPESTNAMVVATLNLRETADTSSRIVGWVGSSTFVRIIGQAFSPQGYLYYNVETVNGSSGWVYSRWVLKTPN